MGLTGFAIVLCLGGLIIWLIYTYNRFLGKQSKIDKLWDEVDTHLKLRRKLIPDLIQAENDRMREAAPLFDRVCTLRKDIESADDEDEIDERLENEMSGLMQQIREIAQTHPELMSDQKFISLLGELVSIEGRAASACEIHNQLVRDFNEAIKSFPANLVVRFLHFSPCEMRIFGVLN